MWNDFFHIQTSVPSLSATAEDGWVDNDISYEELFKPYEQFGLTYDIEDRTQAGNDFFNENSIVNVYAVRDFSNFVRSDDGSFDPSGKLIGVKEFSETEFSARDIESIKNPAPIVSIAGDPPSEKELEDMAKEYEKFGVTYDVKNDQWYFTVIRFGTFKMY